MKKLKRIIIEEYEKDMNFSDKRVEIKEKLEIKSETKLNIKKRLLIQRMKYATVLLIFTLIIGSSFTYLGYKLNDRGAEIPSYEDIISEKLSEFVIDTLPLPFYTQVIEEQTIIYYYVGINEENETLLIANVHTIRDYIQISFSYEDKNIEVNLDDFIEDNSRWFALEFEETNILQLDVNVIDNILINISEKINLNVGEYLNYIRSN